MGGNGWREMFSCPTAKQKLDARAILVWHTFQGVMVTDSFHARECRYNAYWQEIPNRWIDTRKRQPTEWDADVQRCIIVLDKYGDIRMRGWHVVADASAREYPAWMPPPKPPEDYKTLRKNAE